MSNNEELKDAVNSFILSMEEEQKKIDSYREVEKSEKEIFIEKNKNRKNCKEGSLKNETEYYENIKNILKNIVEMIVGNGEIKVNFDIKNYNLSIYGNDLSIAIGKNGKNLEAIEYLINLIARRKKIIENKLTIDIKNYRKKQIEKLNKLAARLAEKVIKEQKKIFLKPMPSYERKIIHNFLSGIKEVETKSTDREPNRRIIIYPAGNRN